MAARRAVSVLVVAEGGGDDLGLVHDLEIVRLARLDAVGLTKHRLDLGPRRRP